MVHSRLPLPSLLGLFGTLLMLSPELLLGIAGKLSELPATDPGVQEALAFAVLRFNQNRRQCRNYFKQLQLQKALVQVETRDEYHLKVKLVKTACRKRAEETKSYTDIQQCSLLPGIQEKQTCYFIVSLHLSPNEMTFEMIACT